MSNDDWRPGIPTGGAIGDILVKGSSADGITRDRQLEFIPQANLNFQTAVNVKAFGAIGDGSADDTDAIQAAIDACEEGGTVFVPDGSYVITTALSITKSIALVGEGQYTSVILAVGVAGIVIAQGVTSVRIACLEVARSVRHTTTGNTSIGIQVLGVTGSRPRNHVYEDIYVDGFQTGIETNWLWSSSFRNVRVDYCSVGLYAKGLSVNNMFTHGTIGCDAASGSRGILIGDGTNATEGWIISDTLVDSAQIGVEGVGATHCKVVNSIIDHNTNTGVIVRDGAAVFGGNWEILGNYIAMSGTADAGITLGNTVSNVQDRGCRVANNLVIVYSGATCRQGIKATASHSKRHVIMGNTIGSETVGFTNYDIDAAYSNGIVIVGNQCLSAIAANIAGGEHVVGNTGVLYYARAYQRVNVGRIAMTWDEAVPTVGTWKVGDICWKVNPAAGGTPGWVCTTAGTPGTWKAIANLAA